MVRTNTGSASKSAIQNSSYTYAADAQASDAYAITLSPAVTAYVAGQQFTFKANTLNTGAASLNVNGLGAKTIKKNTDQDLATGDIEAGTILLVEYDGTNFQLLSATAVAPGSGDVVGPASATDSVFAQFNGTTGKLLKNSTSSPSSFATSAQGATADAALPKAGGALTGALNEAKGADIASATTTDIGAATGNYVVVTGTTTITGLGTVQAGTRRIVKFSGILILTHNATSLILPSSANITTAADDTATFISLGSGNWVCTNYDRKAGTALVASGGAVASGTFSVSVSTSMTTLFDLTSLDGDTDGVWKLTFAGSSATSNQSRIKLMFNSNDVFTYQKRKEDATIDDSGASAVCYVMGRGGGNESLNVFISEILIKSTKTKGTRRQFQGVSCYGNGNYNWRSIYGFWDDTTTNITSLQIAASSDSGTSTFVGHYKLEKVS